MIDFNPLISNFLKRGVSYKTIGRYYPSEAGNCVRKIYYSYRTPKETDVEILKVFEMGNLVHGFIVDVLKSEKNSEIELIASEDPFQVKIDNFVVSGRIDDVLLVKADNKLYVIEVKSTADLSYTKEPNEAHVYQIQLYMHHSKIKEGIILYVEKNTLQAKSFVINYDETKLNEALDRFRLLDNSLRNKILPIPEARKNDLLLALKCQVSREGAQAIP